MMLFRRLVNRPTGPATHSTPRRADSAVAIAATPDVGTQVDGDCEPDVGTQVDGDCEPGAGTQVDGDCEPGAGTQIDGDCEPEVGAGWARGWGWKAQSLGPEASTAAVTPRHGSGGALAIRRSSNLQVFHTST